VDAGQKREAAVGRLLALEGELFERGLDVQRLHERRHVRQRDSIRDQQPHDGTKQAAQCRHDRRGRAAQYRFRGRVLYRNAALVRHGFAALLRITRAGKACESFPQRRRRRKAPAGAASQTAHARARKQRQ
jgi:hypothetical protein